MRSVLYIIVDDLRTGFGAYGHIQHGGAAVTPHLDKLARESLVFEQAYAQVAVCVPSRNSFLTGRRPRTTHVYNFGVGYPDFRAAPGGDSWVTLPEYFKAHGYLVGGTGKTFHPGSPPNFDQPRSWSEELPHQHSKGGRGTGCAPGAEDSDDAEGTCEGGECEADEGGATPGVAWCEVPDELEAEHEDSLAVDAALDALHLMAADGARRPFFLMAGLHKPHSPFNIPRRWFGAYPLDEITVAAHGRFPPNTTGLEYFGCQAVDAQYALDWTEPLPPPTQRALRRAYFAATAFSDHNVGRLLGGLERSGRAADALVVLHSDHGYSLGEKNLWCKSTCFNMALKAPMMVRAPHLPAAAGRTRAVVELVDLFPSVVELAGLPPHAAAPGEPPLEGVSFAPLLTDAAGACAGERATAWACVKPAAYSQFARHRCKGQLQTNHCPGAGGAEARATFMGYSVRTEAWRYTLWVGFDAASDSFVSASTNMAGETDWAREYGEELYDHRRDYELHMCGDDYDADEPRNLLGAEAHTQPKRRGAPRSEEAAAARAQLKLLLYRHFAAADALPALEARLQSERIPPPLAPAPPAPPPPPAPLPPFPPFPPLHPIGQAANTPARPPAPGTAPVWPPAPPRVGASVSGGTAAGLVAALTATARTAIEAAPVRNAFRPCLPTAPHATLWPIGTLPHRPPTGR